MPTDKVLGPNKKFINFHYLPGPLSPEQVKEIELASELDFVKLFGNRDKPDPNIHLLRRATTSAPRFPLAEGRLTNLHRYDDDIQLAYVYSFEFSRGAFIGWLRSHEVIELRYWDDNRQCWYIDQHHFKPMWTLPLDEVRA